jgi:hypothetical protein
MLTLEGTSRGAGATMGVAELPRKMHPLEVILLGC